MFASELSQPNNSALSPFCLSVGDFSRGRGRTPAPVVPSVPTWASMTSGARVFRLPLAPPIGSVDVGEGNSDGFANMGWGAHLTSVFLGTSQRNPQAPSESSMLSKPARVLSPGWWILLSIFCLDDFRHVLSWAEENKYINYLSTPHQELKGAEVQVPPRCPKAEILPFSLLPSFLVNGCALQEKTKLTKDQSQISQDKQNTHLVPRV